MDWLRAYLGRHYVGVVHRLDRNTSGLMVFAKRSKAAARLSASLRSGALRRRYLALLWGAPPAAFTWRDWLSKEAADNTVHVVRPSSPGAREALLTGRTLDTRVLAGSSLSLVEFSLETGRSHQIRVQGASRGHPLVGDRKYGPDRPPLLPRPALHSAHLAFPHPMDADRELSFSESLPPDLQRLWDSA